MDRSRKASREGTETTFHYRSRNETLLDAELIEDKLSQLVAFIVELRQDSAGSAQLQRRSKRFGECKRGTDDSSAEFYAKLHHWLERDIPQTKSPLHPPRQTDIGAIGSSKAIHPTRLGSPELSFAGGGDGFGRLTSASMDHIASGALGTGSEEVRFAVYLTFFPP